MLTFLVGACLVVLIVYALFGRKGCWGGCWGCAVVLAVVAALLIVLTVWAV